MYIDTQTGIRLKALRTAAGDRMVDVAAKVGISESLLSRIESGQRRATPQVLRRLATHFDVTPESLESEPTGRGPLGMHGTLPHAHWPDGYPHPMSADDVDTMALAEVVMTTTMQTIMEQIPSDDHVARYRTCKALAELASRPLEALMSISHSDDDPLVRQAACQMLATLSTAYCDDEL